MAPAKERLHHFDVLKGIAIFTVVMGHVVAFCIREIDRTTLFKIIALVHMPLFFFISGWFAYGRNTDGSIKRPKLWSKIRQLIIPAVLVSTLWIYYYPNTGLESPLDSTFRGLWTAPMKNGYWFTLCLFGIIVVYYLFCPILAKCRSFFSAAVASLAVWGVLFCIAHIIIGLDEEWASFLGLDYIFMYWLPFSAGLLASRYRDGFHRLTESDAATTVSLLLGGLLLYLIGWYWDFGIKEDTLAYSVVMHIAPGVLHVCLAIVAVAVVRPWVTQSYAALQPGERPGRWIRIWSYLGVNSLGIYLLHYFFLFPMGIFRPVAEAMNVSFVPMFVVTAICAAAITLVTLGVIRILRISPTLSMLLTGTSVKK